MNHLLQNDTDEAVKREAHKALEQIRKAEELGVVVQ
jgi:hypothetical protein